MPTFIFTKGLANTTDRVLPLLLDLWNDGDSKAIVYHDFPGSLYNGFNCHKSFIGRTVIRGNQEFATFSSLKLKVFCALLGIVLGKYLSNTVVMENGIENNV